MAPSARISCGIIPPGDIARTNPFHTQDSFRASQESSWFAVYAATLWLLVAILASTFGKRLTLQRNEHAN